jgi:hypothetical protein
MKHDAPAKQAFSARRASGSSRFPALALLLTTLGAGAVAWGCGSAVDATQPTSNYGNPPGSGGGGGNGSQDGLPCDVANVIAAHCLDCHASTLKGGATMPLMSYADLAAPSAIDPAVSVAQRSVLRMNDAASPMPPGAGVSVPAADIAVLQAWVDAGLPMGSCDSPDAGPDPFDGPVQCTSGKYWTLGNEGSKYMHPGNACIACHTKEHAEEPEAVIYAVAGTVYPTAHEPDDCVATGVQGATVEVTEADGTVSALAVNSSGNFFLEKAGFVYPYTARVLFDGRERVMHAEQTDGDCNGCHTQDGDYDAPGRILLP